MNVYQTPKSDAVRRINAARLKLDQARKELEVAYADYDFACAKEDEKPTN